MSIIPSKVTSSKSLSEFTIFCWHVGSPQLRDRLIYFIGMWPLTIISAWKKGISAKVIVVYINFPFLHMSQVSLWCFPLISAFLSVNGSNCQQLLYKKKKKKKRGNSSGGPDDTNVAVADNEFIFRLEFCNLENSNESLAWTSTIPLSRCDMWNWSTIQPCFPQITNSRLQFRSL